MNHFLKDNVSSAYGQWSIVVDTGQWSIEVLCD